MAKTGMTKQQFIEWALSRGWKQDKFGHLQKTIRDTKYRFKIQKNSVRYERQIIFDKTEYSSKKTEWLRVRSGFLKDLSIDSEGKLKGLR